MFTVQPHSHGVFMEMRLDINNSQVCVQPHASEITSPRTVTAHAHSHLLSHLFYHHDYPFQYVKHQSLLTIKKILQNTQPIMKPQSNPHPKDHITIPCTKAKLLQLLIILIELCARNTSKEPKGENWCNNRGYWRGNLCLILQILGVPQQDCN